MTTTNWRFEYGEVWADVNGKREPVAGPNRSNSLSPVERDDIGRQLASLPFLLDCLEEIARCKGAFDHDPHEHAKNVIARSKELAEMALKVAKEGVTT